MALAMSPLYLIPPSAITGTPLFEQASTALITAVNWGTPTPVTILVVHIEPGPIPTLIAFAPLSISASAASGVPTFPAMICASGPAWSLMARTVSRTPWEWPWAVSTATASAPTSNIARALRMPNSPVPVAATTRSLPRSSLHDRGLSLERLMSRTVIRPEKPPSGLTTTSFSILCWWSSLFASSRSTCSGTVTNSFVITSETAVSSSSTNLMSLFVTIPTMLPSPSITGNPEKPYWSFFVLSSPTVIFGSTVTGSRTRPDSNLLTLSTSTA